jgi:DNA-binding CsgD family transcriptional regulator
MPAPALEARRPALRGRAAEGATLERTLAGVRAGRSAVLVLRGEAGIGKSALLEHAAERAVDCRLLRAAGVESEMELPFASLHALCAPLLGGIDALPEPQREALGAAFGQRAADAPDRLVLGLALLGLLSTAAEDGPLVCLVDDAHWLDASSAQVLGLVARRIRDVPVALLFAERTGVARDELAGLPTLRVEGLGDADARALLATAAACPLDGRIRDRIVAETHGNPLALLELPRGLTAGAMDGGFGPGVPLPSRIEASFRRQVGALPPDTQRLLLAAAAEPIGDPTLLWRALAELGIPVDAASPAETDGLLATGARVTFRHPLLRSAVYRAAPPDERRAVHRALAEVTDPQLDPDRRAWHRAQGTLGPDEGVAEELERAADRAQVRGGFPAAAAFLERATALTLDPRRRAARALASAQAKFAAGAFDDAVDLLGLAESSGALDPLDAAQASLLRAQIAFVAGRISAAVPLLLEAAERLRPVDPARARDTYLEAFHAAFAAGRFRDGGGTRAVAVAARGLLPVDGRVGPPELLLDGMAVMLGGFGGSGGSGRLGGYAAGAPLVGTALEAFRAQDLPGRQELDWLPVACRMAMNVFAFESWDVLSARLVERSREAGAIAVLPIALVLRLLNRLFAGEFDVAAALNAEVEAVSDATGRRIMTSYGAVALAAWSGREQATDAAIEVAREQITVHGSGQLLTTTQWARAVLLNGLGRFDEALKAAEQTREYPEELGLSTWALVELIEAAALSGDEARATAGLAELVPITQASGTDWALGTEARTRALVEHEAAESLLHESLTRLRRTGMRVGLARTHLHLGEWLRRENRRLEAREHLRTAQEMFGAMGGRAFADRAGRSLLATGEKARRRTDDTRGELTAQEAQIAELARQGLSNPEIGARLFISPRTAEYHLSKVFSKLEITSRTQLEQALPAAQRA